MTSHTATPSPMVLTTAGGADKTRRTATPSPMVGHRADADNWVLPGDMRGAIGG